MNVMKPLISVVIPVYNRSEKILRALKSVQSQTYENWEVIVVDDASDDNTAKFVHDMSLQDKRISCVLHFRNKGAQGARNTGIRKALGEWVAFLDSDDEFLPESLASRINIALTENSSAVHSHAYIAHPDKPRITYASPAFRGRIYKDILKKDGPTFPSLLVQKKALENIGYLDEDIFAFQEWDTCIRLAEICTFSFLPQETFIYDNTSEDSISRDFNKGAYGYKQIVKKHFWKMWLYGGARTLGYHFQVISRWYKMGGDEVNANKYRVKSLIWKCISPSVLFNKLRNMVITNDN
jgi:glycosyltransferase involved in cell wall biosynthesis